MSLHSSWCMACKLPPSSLILVNLSASDSQSSAETVRDRLISGDQSHPFPFSQMHASNIPVKNCIANCGQTVSDMEMITTALVPVLTFLHLLVPVLDIPVSIQFFIVCRLCSCTFSLLWRAQRFTHDCFIPVTVCDCHTEIKGYLTWFDLIISIL